MTSITRNAENPKAVVENLASQLNQLMSDLTLLIARFSIQQYRVPQAPLESSIGAHVRHILECHQQFVIGRSEGLLNYDERVRCPTLEESPKEALILIEAIQRELAEINLDATMSLVQDDGSRIATSVARELRHLIDHATHHLATIAIAARLAHMPLPDGVGLAASTRKNQRC